jgi:predicted methyltransferase
MIMLSFKSIGEYIMNRRLFTLALTAFAASTALAAASAPPRPAEDMARDAARKPAAMMAFAKVKPGQVVVDMMPGGGYFTRVFSNAVGSKGKVIALVPDALAARKPEAATGMQALAAEPGLSNVSVAVQPLTNLGAPSSVDLVWTAQNYHDLHNPTLPAQTLTFVNKAVFAALKPGGLYIVLDHVAASGSGLRDVNTLHRIDPTVVKAEVLAAGFTFGGESKVLANPADDHSKGVFDPSVRGHTDQFIYRFRKPLK